MSEIWPYSDEGGGRSRVRLDFTEYAANESSFVTANKILRSLARDISRRQWCIGCIRQSFRFVVGATRDGECLGVATGPKGA